MAANMMLHPTLQLFKKPETDYSIDSYRMVTIQPTTTGINPMTVKLSMERMTETASVSRNLV